MTSVVDMLQTVASWEIYHLLDGVRSDMRLSVLDVFEKKQSKLIVF